MIVRQLSTISGEFSNLADNKNDQFMASNTIGICNFCETFCDQKPLINTIVQQSQKDVRLLLFSKVIKRARSIGVSMTDSQCNF